MNLLDTIIGPTLARQLGQLAYPIPSQTDVASATKRVWERLQNEVPEKTSGIVSISVAIRSPWISMKVACVAALAAALIVVAVQPTARTLWRRSPPALIDTVGSGLLRVEREQARAIYAGEPIAFGELIRSHVGAEAVFHLADGSSIEMRPNSELALEQADDGVRIRLGRGGVLVTAARQRTGHLYVQTKDLAVSVVGTVFFVTAEEAGSRVAVIQGEVHVQQSTGSKKLLPGNQVATNPLMELHAVSEEISWSQSAAAHLALLQQSVSQTNTAAGSTQGYLPLRFEIASIKPVQRAGVFVRLPDRIRCKGVDGILITKVIGANTLPASAAVGDVPLGRCIGNNVPLISLIALAYDIPAGQYISGSSNEDELYQIEAKAGSGSATKEQLRQMMQSLLADRFALKVHRETKEVGGYILVVGKNGPKFKETSGEEENLSPVLVSGVGVVQAKFRMNTFAQSLGMLDNNLFPVIDRTNLPNIYDLQLKLRYAAPGPGGRSSATFDPPLPQAIEEQLGLRLESGKVPVEYLVVDHVEKPSEN